MTIFDLLKNPEYAQKTILEKIVSHVLGVSREELIINTDRIIQKEEESMIQNYYKAYTIEKKPLEYILGYVEFLGRKFEVSPDTLIPRPETEYMILSTNQFLTGKKNVLLCDIGTGCGVLGISTLCENKEAITHAYLTEISPSALSIAKKNWQHFSESEQISPEKISFLESSIIDFMKEQEIQDNFKKADVVCIVGNLPYIPEQTFEENVEDSVKLREPKFAFVGGEDGLDRYRILFNEYISKYKALMDKTTFFLEMMTRQKSILENEYGNIFQFETCDTFHFNIIILKVTQK